MPKTVDKYDKERLDVLHKIFNILGINENNNKFLLHELDSDVSMEKLDGIPWYKLEEKQCYHKRT